MTIVGSHALPARGGTVGGNGVDVYRQVGGGGGTWSCGGEVHTVTPVAQLIAAAGLHLDLVLGLAFKSSQGEGGPFDGDELAPFAISLCIDAEIIDHQVFLVRIRMAESDIASGTVKGA